MLFSSGENNVGQGRAAWRIPRISARGAQIARRTGLIARAWRRPLAFLSLALFFYLALTAWRFCLSPAEAAPWEPNSPAGRFDDSTISVLIDRKKYLSELRIVPGGSFRERPGAAGREISYSTVVFTGREGVSRFDFPGELAIESGGGWHCLINRVAVKDYIACVLISELESSEPELMSAMAALVRTLVCGAALTASFDPESSRHPYELFLLCARTHCASYRGIISRSRFVEASRAVERVAGLALYHGGRPVHCFYSSSCGGRVKSAADIYRGAAGAPYFEEKPCPCAHSAKRWKNVYPGAALSRVLGVRVAAVETSSPPYRIVVNSKFGYTFDEFIAAIEKSSLPRLKSPDFKAAYDPGSDSFVFEGTGLGHGAGLCIAGARAMAARGDGYKKILNYYYKSCILKSVDL